MTPFDDWALLAACRGLDYDLFYPEREDSNTYAKARRICLTCPVRVACLEAAMDEERGQGRAYRAGMRGALGPAARYALARKRRQEGAA